MDAVKRWLVRAAQWLADRRDRWWLGQERRVTPAGATDPYPWNYGADYGDEDDYDARYDSSLDGWDELDEFEEALQNCSMMADGFCGQAGSEWCDWDCPIRDMEIIELEDDFIELEEEENWDE